MRKNGVILSSVIVALSATTTLAGVLYKEDFQSAAPGQQLSTLGFTYPAPGTSAVVQNTAEVGLAFDGRLGNGSSQTGGVPAVRHTIPTASPGATSVEISIDAWIPGPNANQAFELFGNGPGDARWADISKGGGNFSSNFFNSSGGYVSTYTFPGTSGLTNQTVNMKIVYDIATNMIHTELNGMSSPSLALDPGSHTRMTEIEIYNDQRGGVNDPATGQGSIWDNLMVTQIPEPASVALLGLGGIVCLGRLRRRTIE